MTGDRLPADTPPVDVGMSEDLAARMIRLIEEAVVSGAKRSGGQIADFSDSICEGFIVIGAWRDGPIPEGMRATTVVSSPGVDLQSAAPVLRRIADLYEAADG